MKKSLFILTAVLALVIASCQKAEIPQLEVNNNRILTVTADIAQFNIETKTSIDGAATTIRPVWSSGDKIKLFNTEGNSAVYVVNTGAETSSATFKLDTGQTALTGTFACAYYPADSAKAYTAGTGISAGIPSSQTYTANGTGENAGTFANGSFPMVGYGTLNTEGTNMNLTFKNLFGLVQINLKDDASATVSRIDIVSESALSGTATVTPQTSVEGTPTCTVAGNKYVTLVASTPITLNSTASTAFYIAVPVCTLSKVYVTSSSKLIMKNTSSTIVRNQIRNMPNLTISDETAVTYSEYPDAKPVVVAGILWAPVNCGYEPASGDNKGYTYGRLYQWGRKYGHGYKDSSYEDDDYPGKTGGSQPKDTIKNENDQLTSHPDVTSNSTFYSISSVDPEFTSFNWYKGSEPVSATAPAPNKLWNSNEGTSNPVSKSDYDPCPEGWRVPTKIEMETLLNATTFTNVDSGNHGSSSVKGSKFVGNDGDDDNFVFLPRSGYLQTGGTSSQRGTKPYYWSSSVDNNNSYYLTASGKFSPQQYHVNTEKRVLGCSVRCVKE